MMKRLELCLIAVAAPAWVAGCAGYNLQLGTGSDASAPGGFYEVYEKPATSVETPAERSTTGRVPAPPPDVAPAESDPKAKDRAAGSSK
jgi:hypothetical protein